MQHFDLSARVAIVTGGNGGIGLGMAKGLARAGASVAVVGRNADKNEAAAAVLRSLGAKVLAIEADLLQESACRDLVLRAAEHFGRLDILVNNAGVTVRKPPQELSAQEWHHIIDSNLTSAFLCSQAAHAPMKRCGGGKIINIGSLMSSLGAPFAAAYGASKGGIVQMTRSMATAWGADNIQVNAILPGWIKTDLTAGARRELPGLDERVLSRTPAGRWGEPEDFEAITMLLAGRGSQFITGTAIFVDGGYSIQA